MTNYEYENKISDDEIISSLKVIATTRNCSECKLRNCKWKACDCSQITANTAFDLINRQKTEIERLQKEVNLVSIQFQDLQERCEEAQTEIEQWKEEANKYQKLWCIAVNDIETAKAEAYKEFAERLNEEAQIADCFDSYKMVVGTHFIDNLLKEMLGEE